MVKDPSTGMMVLKPQHGGTLTAVLLTRPYDHGDSWVTHGAGLISGPVTDKIGQSLQKGHRPVEGKIFKRVPVTLELEAAALIIGLVIALPVGIYSAVRQDTLGDYAGRSITIGTVIITEASLSFLGFGLPLNVPSWGGLLSREGRRYMQVAPWLAMWPGIFLTIVVYSLNMFGDAMRDLLDPRLRGGQGSYGATTKRKRSFLARLINPFNQ